MLDGTEADIACFLEGLAKPIFAFLPKESNPFLIVYGDHKVRLDTMNLVVPNRADFEEMLTFRIVDSPYKQADRPRAHRFTVYITVGRSIAYLEPEIGNPDYGEKIAERIMELRDKMKKHLGASKNLDFRKIMRTPDGYLSDPQTSMSGCASGP